MDVCRIRKPFKELKWGYGLNWTTKNFFVMRLKWEHPNNPKYFTPNLLILIFKTTNFIIPKK